MLARFFPLFCDANNQFAKVSPCKQADKGLWRVFQTINKVFLEFDPAIRQPLAHLGEKFAIAMAVVVKNNETLHADTLD